jgi:hypothetical protein
MRRAFGRNNPFEHHVGGRKIFTYARMTDLAADARQIEAKWQNCGHETPISYRECCDVLVSGDEKQVPSAQRLLDKLMVESLEVSQPAWMREVAGAYPSVPDFLANDPESMFTLQPVESPTAPITVWIDLMSSGGCSLQELENRGIAMLALVLKLQQVRPVRMNVCYGAPSNGCGLVLPWPTQPVELATTCAVLCRGELTRLPLMAILRKASQDYIGMGLQTDEEMRGFFEIPEGDLVLRAMILNNTLMRTNPVAWVNEQLKKAGALAPVD